MELVSVVMAAYNGERFIESQIKSILAQTHSNIELLIVDDCSNDNTKSIIEKIILTDNRVKLIFNDKNIGCSKSFEKGLMFAQGKYIALCDQDDVWMNNKIEILIRELLDYELIYSNCNIINERDDIIGDSFNVYNPLFGADSTHPDLSILVAMNSFVLGCSCLFNRSLLKYIIPFVPDKYNHDKWIVFIAGQIGNIKFFDQKLFSYRIHENNYSFSESKCNKGFFIKIKDLFLQEKARPFYSSRVLGELVNRLNVGDGGVIKVRDDIEKFERGGFVNRLLFIIKYHRFLFKTKSIINRVKCFLVLTLN